MLSVETSQVIRALCSQSFVFCPSFRSTLYFIVSVTFRDQLAAKEEALKSLQSEHQQSVFKTTTLEATLLETRKLHSSTKQEIKTEHDALRQKYESKCEEIHRLKQTTDKLLDERLQALNAKEATLQRLQSELDEIQKARQHLQDTVVISLREQINNLEDQTKVHLSEIQTLSEHRDRLQQDLSNISKKLDMKTEEMNAFKRNEHETLNKKLGELSAKYDSDCALFQKQMDILRGNHLKSEKEWNLKMEHVRNQHQSERNDLDGQLKLVKEELNELKLK